MSAKDGDRHSSTPPLKRRGLLLGAGAAGAAALAAKALPGAAPPASIEPAAASAAAADSGGYRLTPHVLRYYETART